MSGNCQVVPTHLYCLLAAASDWAVPTDTGAVRALGVGDIVAWVATTNDKTLSREGRRAAQRAMEHDQVIGRAVARGLTPVPATLADAYPSDDAAIVDISMRSAEISDSLRRIEGAVEMAVILAARTDAPESESTVDQGPGRAYLERLRELPALLTTAADEVDRLVQPHALASSRRSDRDRVGLSHLIRRGDVAAYRAIALDCASGRYRMVVDGPRAPYSFAAFSPNSGGGRALGRHETGNPSRD